MYYFVVRLAGGYTEYVGRVEVYYNSKWYRFCDTTWDLNEAQVVCHELGYGAAITAGHTPFYGQDRGDGVFLNDLKCFGTESTIRNCLHKGFNVRYCYTRRVTGVACATG